MPIKVTTFYAHKKLCTGSVISKPDFTEITVCPYRDCTSMYVCIHMCAAEQRRSTASAGSEVSFVGGAAHILDIKQNLTKKYTQHFGDFVNGNEIKRPRFELPNGVSIFFLYVCS